MTYQIILTVVLCLALLNRDARPFALVMVANWIFNDLLIRNQLWVWVSVSDAVAFIAFALLTLKRPTWWSFLVSELAFGAVVVHATYWLAFGFGLYFGREYQIVLNGAFGLAALILIYGSYDVGNRLGSAWHSLTRAPDLRRRHVYTRQKTSHSEDAR